MNSDLGIIFLTFPTPHVMGKFSAFDDRILQLKLIFFISVRLVCCLSVYYTKMFNDKLFKPSKVCDFRKLFKYAIHIGGLLDAILNSKLAFLKISGTDKYIIKKKLKV